MLVEENGQKVPKPSGYGGVTNLFEMGGFRQFEAADKLALSESGTVRSIACKVVITKTIEGK
jgi:hypothetical protein